MADINEGSGAMLDVVDLAVRFSTEGGAVRAIRNVSFSVQKGEVLSIVGESGSGKTVSLLSILGLVDKRTTKASGHAFFKGHDLLDLSDKALRAIRGRDIALIPQDPMTSLTPVLRVGSQIVEQIKAHEPVSTADAKRRAIALLSDVGLPNPEKIVDRYPHQLSGGMRQRVMIAMALSCNPSLLIADEPTTALDVTVQAQILDLLRQMKRDYRSSIVLITHDMGVVSEMADRVAVMYGGQIVEQGTVHQVLGDPCHPYTWALLASIPPIVGRPPKRLFSIPGLPPNPAQLGDGCAFIDRCDFRRDSCTKPPPVHERDGHRFMCIFSDEESRRMRHAVVDQYRGNLNARV